jgi:hypothetical protein
LEIVCPDHSAEAAAILVRMVYFGFVYFGTSIAEIRIQVQLTFSQKFDKNLILTRIFGLRGLLK